MTLYPDLLQVIQIHSLFVKCSVLLGLRLRSVVNFDKNKNQKFSNFQLLIRFVCSPSKRAFLGNFLNIIDIISILPFYVNMIIADIGTGAELSILRGEFMLVTSAATRTHFSVLRLVRVFRIFKLSRHSSGLQILGKTFAASAQEFGLLFFFLLIAVVLFSSGIYFVENGAYVTEIQMGRTNATTKFTSIPATFW